MWSAVIWGAVVVSAGLRVMSLPHVAGAVNETSLSSLISVVGSGGVTGSNESSG